MKHLHKSHIVSKSFAISIALICWAAAFINFTKDYKHSATQAVTAFSTSSINHIYNSIQITPINKTTYELSINNQNKLNKTELFNNVYKYLTTYYDRDINLISIHPAKGYNDYYLYRSQLCNNKNISPLSGGFNFQIAITNTKKIYIGIPCIDYDF